MVASELPRLALVTAQIEDIIRAICDRVVLAVNTNGQYRAIRTGRSKVPPELVHAALTLVRHACISKAPGDGLDATLAGSTRTAEYNQAQELLKRLEEGEMWLEDYTIDADPEDLVSDDEANGSLTWDSDPVQDTGCLFGPCERKESV